MDSNSVTIKVLEQIRDSVGQTNTRLDALTARVVEGEHRTTAAIETLTDRVVEGEIRTATAIMALGGTLNDVRSLLKERLDLSDRVQRCEHDIVVLKERAGFK